MKFLVHSLFNELSNWLPDAEDLIVKYYNENSELNPEYKEIALDIFNSKVQELMLWVIDHEHNIKNKNVLIDNINTLFDKIGNLGVWLNTYINEENNVALQIFRKYKAEAPLATL